MQHVQAQSGMSTSLLCRQGGDTITTATGVYPNLCYCIYICDLLIDAFIYFVHMI